jgi:hypothetical protein
LTDLSDRQATLERFQLESPDYVVHKTELTPGCIDTFAYRIQIKSPTFRYFDLQFSSHQEMEYRVLSLLLEHKLVFQSSSYDDTVYVRRRLFGNTLMDRIGNHDVTLVQDLAQHALDCGLDEIDLLLGGMLPPTTP